MKMLLVTLLLVFQFQPLVGTVACVERSAKAARHECKMADHGQVPVLQIRSTDAAAQNCAAASICTPAPPAVPALAARWETTALLLASAGPLLDTSLVGIPPVPPFHPPRA
jgi:hypothetical protein